MSYTTHPSTLRRLSALFAVLIGACSTSSVSPDSGGDAGDVTAADDGPFIVEPASLAHCQFESTPANANAAGALDEGDVRAGAADVLIDMPVGSALGAFTARARFLGSVGMVDSRRVEYAGAFHPSIGIETAPHVRALALTAGSETVVILKADIGLAFDGATYEIARRLGPAFSGKVLFATSHSHSQFAQFTSNTALGVGLGVYRQRSFERLVDASVRAARAALMSREPARIGIAHDPNFDPMDRVTRDRRNENDDLPRGRNRKDSDLFVIRVDRADGTPIAILPVFGVHGTVLDADNNLASTDAPGAIERAVEESFDRQVVVMHLQGAAGDVSPAGSGGIDCMRERSCYNFARAESVGHAARDSIIAAWRTAGTSMQDRLRIEMLTRAIQLGPDWRTFTVRNGALRYAEFAPRRAADGRIFDAMGVILSPIDEFNAPVGAALCGEDHDAFVSWGQMPGTRGVRPYRSCMRLDAAAALLGPLVEQQFERGVICASSRTTISALRLGDFILGALPGEPLTLLADRVRALSPVAPERTIVLGFAQGHMGYLLTADDWLRAGYEPSINFWGPLEGEYIVERLTELLRLAANDVREDGQIGGVDRIAVPTVTDNVPPPDAPVRVGTVPDTLPMEVYFRLRAQPGSGQPATMVRRLESAYFAWLGEDPLNGTPRVTLQRERLPGTGEYVDVTRRSGRAVTDGDLLLTWTPQPLAREGTNPRTHYWGVEWQAIQPWGTRDAADLEERLGLPLGRYRFRVAGTGYTVESRAFDVSAGALSITARRDGTHVQISVGVHNPRGWRLLTTSQRSNERVTLGTTAVDVVLVNTDATERTLSMQTTNAMGELRVDAGAGGGNVVRVRVIDRYGNTGDAAL